MPHVRTGVWEEVHVDFWCIPGTDPEVNVCDLVTYDAFTHYLISIPMGQICPTTAKDHIHFGIILTHGRPGKPYTRPSWT